jgi:hypothetical protein
MEDRLLRHWKAGLPLLQQPYSTAAGRKLHDHLQATPDEMDRKDMREVSRYWSKQKPGACIVQVRQVVDQYLQWLLPVLWPGGMATNSSSSSSSSSAGGRSSSTPTPTGDQVYVHVGCIIYCLIQCTSQLFSAIVVGDSTAAAVGAHLLKPRTGENQVEPSSAGCRLLLQPLHRARMTNRVCGVVVSATAGGVVDRQQPRTSDPGCQ